MRLVKLAVLLALLPLAVWAADLKFPALTGRVVDQANVLPAPVVQQLDQMLAAEEKNTGNQVVVATVSSLQGVPIEQYGYQLGRAWGIGQKDKNNGIVFLIAPSEHKLRIEVGYGLEGTLTDAQSKLIIENIALPKIKAGDLPGGLVAGTQAILQVIDPEGTGPTPEAAQNQPASQNNSQLPLGSIVPFAGMILLIVFLLLRGGLFLPFLFLSGMFGGRGGGGGSDDDDNFSGGGGSFGGGGSSGSW